MTERGGASQRSTGTARASVGAMLIAGLTMAVASASSTSPLTPPLPAEAKGAALLRWIAASSGLNGATQDARVAVSLVATVLVSVSFVVLARRAWDRTVSVRSLALLGVALHVLVLLMPLIGSRDVYSYAMYGRMIDVHGTNPYLASPADFPGDPFYRLVSPIWRNTPAVYGPLFLRVASAVSRLAADPATAVLWFKGLAAIGSLGTALLVYRVVLRRAPERGAFAVAMTAVNPAIVFSVVGGGHVDALVSLSLAAALALLALHVPGDRPGWRPLVATAVLTFGALTKVVVALPLGLLILRDANDAPKGRRAKRLLAHVAVVATVATPLVAPFFQTRDPSFGLASLAPFGSPAAPWMFLHESLVPLGRALAGTAGASAVSWIIRISFGLVAVVTFALLARHSVGQRNGRPGTEWVEWGWALLIVMLSLQLVFPWYVAWVVPVSWLLPRLPRMATIAISATLPIAMAIADRSRSPLKYEGLQRLLLYVVAPALLLLLVRLLVDLRRWLRAPAEHDPMTIADT